MVKHEFNENVYSQPEKSDINRLAQSERVKKSTKRQSIQIKNYLNNRRSVKIQHEYGKMHPLKQSLLGGGGGAAAGATYGI